MTKEKMYEVINAETTVVFKENLTLEEANEYVRFIEKVDRNNEEYTPDSYLILEMEMYQVESALTAILFEKNLTIQQANDFVKLLEQKDTKNECFVANFYRITPMNGED
jgi:predicted transcriptional regulator